MENTKAPSVAALLGVGLYLGLAVTPAHAVSLTLIDTNFNEELKIAALGGTVTHINGATHELSGVTVTLPGWIFALGYTLEVIDPNAEPGNSPTYLPGPPTDLTFTAPGPGGPDGGVGDGSVKLKNLGTVTLSFPQTITAPLGVINDLFLITDTANGGKVTVEIPGVDPFISGKINATSYGNPWGGLLLDIPDGFQYSQVTLSIFSGNIEIDALAANTTPASIVNTPEPGTWALLTIGLLGLGIWRGRKLIHAGSAVRRRP
jgi:hypothetical protein